MPFVPTFCLFLRLEFAHSGNPQGDCEARARDKVCFQWVMRWPLERPAA